MIELFGTLGPACADREIIAEMLKQGMHGMRLNLSHGSLENSGKMLEEYRAAQEMCGITAELLIDMQGPELRVNKPSEPLEMKRGDRIMLSCSDRGIIIPECLMHVLETGDAVLIDDGVIELAVLSVQQECAEAEVVRGGILKDRKSIKAVNKDVYGPVFTETDYENIRNAGQYDVTAVMQPFVRNGEELKEVRRILNDNGCENLRIFAKIESREGMRNLDGIIPEADMIVIARGDLGNDMLLWDLPAAQKYIGEKCLQADVPFLVVTQMLASMVSSPVPTRAEVSDIFRAVTEGASALMVTNETAAGKYPAEVIRYLHQTAESAEAWMQGSFSALQDQPAIF